LRIKPLIFIHGGAGNYRLFSEEALQRRRVLLNEIAVKSFEVLISKSALDAVEYAVKLMEDSGAFNAGLGSVLTLNKRVEMDAGIMDGKTLNVGAVACISNFGNPISIARRIMEETDHILIAGVSAERLAEFFGFKPDSSLITEEKLERFKKVYDAWIKGERKRMLKIREIVLSSPDLFNFLDTVGAVAIDSDGNVASAVSTGGYWLKLPGRIGDVPLVGCGFYADNEAGAASASGVGEAIAKVTLSKMCCDFMRNGFSAQEACEKAIAVLTRRIGDNTAGIIAVDKTGGYGFAFNTAGMCRSIFIEGMEKPAVAIFPEEPFIVD